MICMVPPKVRDRVLSAVQEHSPRPTELLDLLSELSYGEVQDALSQLLDEGEVDLTSDRHLKPRRSAA